MSEESTRAKPAEEGAAGNLEAPERTANLAPGSSAERIRRDFATAWGEVGSRWGVPPATARVHGYLLAHRQALTEREIRLALGLSHRAAAMALAESEAWGLVERAEPRRAGRRGPAGVAWQAVGDQWRWFGRVVEQRRMREGDPAIMAIERAVADATDAAGRNPDDPSLADLRVWLDSFLAFVRQFDRVASFVARVSPSDLEHAMRLLAGVPDALALRTLELLATIPAEDLGPLLDALAHLPPPLAVRAVRLSANVIGRLGS